MPKTISASEAKNRFSTWLGYVSEQNDEVIVESYGKLKAAVISISALEELQALRDQKRREEALERLHEIRDERAHNRSLTDSKEIDPERRAAAVKHLRALREEVSARNRDLTEEQIAEIVNRFSRELIDDMTAEGKHVFERDLRARRASP